MPLSVDILTEFSDLAPYSCVSPARERPVFLRNSHVAPGNRVAFIMMLTYVLIGAFGYLQCVANEWIARQTGSRVMRATHVN